MTKHTRRVLELGAGLALALTVVLTAYADWHQRTAARVRADTVPAAHPGQQRYMG